MSRMAGIAAGRAHTSRGAAPQAATRCMETEQVVGLRASRGAVASAPGTRRGRGAGRQTSVSRRQTNQRSTMLFAAGSPNVQPYSPSLVVT